MTTQQPISLSDSSSVPIVNLNVDVEVPDAKIKCAGECEMVTPHRAVEFNIDDSDGNAWTTAIYFCTYCGSHKVRKYDRD